MSPDIVAALLGGSLLPTVLGFLWRRLRGDPKGAAETRKLNAEVDDLIATRLYAEIERLDRELALVREELAAVKEVAADEKVALERENRALRGKVSKLTQRVQGLEDILKVKPLPPDMQAMLDRLDRKTGGAS